MLHNFIRIYQMSFMHLLEIKAEKKTEKKITREIEKATDANARIHKQMDNYAADAKID